MLCAFVPVVIVKLKRIDNAEKKAPLNIVFNEAIFLYMKIRILKVREF